jgi:polar amino acid transport system substrate-binding protein
MKRLITIITMMVVGALLVLPAFADDHPADQPLKAAVDMGFVPFAFLTETGEANGFAVDLADALAQRLGRPGAEIVDVQWSGIFAALFSKKVEFIVAPTNITEERAKEMDFTEPYMDTAELIAINPKDKDEIKTLEDLEGKVIGVNTGSSGHIWLLENQDEYGFEIDQYDRMPDAMMAVQVGRIDAGIGDLEAVAYYVKDKPNLAGAIVAPTGQQYGLPCRKGDPFRNELEQALESLKLDGTLAELHEKWFGRSAEFGSAATLVYVGYGTFGMPGFELTYHEIP